MKIPKIEGPKIPKIRNQKPENQDQKSRKSGPKPEDQDQKSENVTKFRSQKSAKKAEIVTKFRSQKSGTIRNQNFSNFRELRNRRIGKIAESKIREVHKSHNWQKI